MSGTTDFTSMSNAEIAQYVQDHHVDFDEGHFADKAVQVLKALTQGTVIERRAFGFAIVHPIYSVHPQGHRRSEAVLWYFYIAPERRRTGLSREFIQDLANQVSAASDCFLLCTGEKRRDFFLSAGFRVSRVGPDGDFIMVLPATSS